MAGASQKASDEEILMAVEACPEPVVGTGELARLFDYTPQGMAPRLKTLRRKGFVESKQVAGVSVWWITELGHKALHGKLRPEDIDLDDFIFED